ncbi:MAG: hypothetical protein U0792_16900 [Gemmataceae bacterium]
MASVPPTPRWFLDKKANTILKDLKPTAGAKKLPEADSESEN